jgi:hypothetical protein
MSQHGGKLVYQDRARCIKILCVLNSIYCIKHLSRIVTTVKCNLARDVIVVERY